MRGFCVLPFARAATETLVDVDKARHIGGEASSRGGSLCIMPQFTALLLVVDTHCSEGTPRLFCLVELRILQNSNGR